MKAAIVVQAGKAPVYGEFREPVAAAEQKIISVSASALTQNAKSRASGAHYSASGQYPLVAGVDGVGRLVDGQRVLFGLPPAPFGAMAERVAVPQTHYVPVPDEVDDITAAAIANPGFSSWAALTLRARFLRGENVLVNGATGTAGRLAIQIAKHLGAGRIVATGRNEQELANVRLLGADETVSLNLPPKELEAALIGCFSGAGIHIVLDYLWGKSAEAILVAAAKGGKDAEPIRFVGIGSASSAEIALPSAALRSSALVLMGSGIGSLGTEGVMGSVQAVLKAVVPGNLRIQTRVVPLAEVEEAWNRDHGKARVVFRIP
jgi:NADPH:quinone reductase-like Zn-dependent oxidoreductase